MRPPISVYPNPATDQLTIVSNHAFVNSTYFVYDSQGRLVLTGNIEAASFVINVDALESGVYSISIPSVALTNTQFIKN
jgi:hypothetical protein